jgi:pimeloyl-ACP methyl ester carboxylesterase
LTEGSPKDSTYRARTNSLSIRRYAGAHGLTLVADVGGDAGAPTVIFLHGGGQTRHSWAGSMRELIAQGYRVLNLDARGHGDSDWAADGDYTSKALTADLACVIDTLDSRPALVGASMGAATALLFAGSASSNAAALILVDLVPRFDPNGAARIRAFMSANPQGFASVDEAAAAVNAYNPHRPASRDAAGLMKNLRERDGRLYWHWDPRVLSNEGSEHVSFGEKLNQAARRVRVPTLLVRGLRSELVTEAGIEDLKTHLEHLEVFDVAEAGHMVVGDKNEVFNSGILYFLRRHLPTAR